MSTLEEKRLKEEEEEKRLKEEEEKRFKEEAEEFARKFNTRSEWRCNVCGTYYWEPANYCPDCQNIR